MNAQSSKLVRTGCLILLSCVTTMGATTPSKAQAVNLPQPAFPEAGTPWGCYFFDTCQSDDALAEDEQTHAAGSILVLGLISIFVGPARLALGYSLFLNGANAPVEQALETEAILNGAFSPVSQK